MNPPLSPSTSAIRRHQQRPHRWRRAAGLMAVLGVLGGCTLIGAGSPRVDDETDSRRDVPDATPADPVLWRMLLGGDSADPRRYDQLDGVTDLEADSFDRVAATVTAVVTAGATGHGRSDYHGVIDPGDGCDRVDIDAVSAYRHGDGVRALVVWTGERCPRPPVDGWPTVTFVELDATFQPVAAVRPPDGDDWPVAALDCAVETLVARVDVAAAWNALCRTARDEGVTLRAVDAYRSVEDQRRHYRQAELQWGALAPFRVEPVDGDRCRSAHCQGTAIDVDDATLAWLQQDLCDDTGCVRRMWTGGFHTPLVHSPRHLEPLVDNWSTAGCGTSSGEVAVVIEQQWRCELRPLGFEPAVVDRIVNGAVAVANCLSGLDPQYASGDRSGVFAMDDRLRRWAGDLRGDVAADAAIAGRLYVHERQWGLVGWPSLTNNSDCLNLVTAL